MEYLDYPYARFDVKLGRLDYSDSEYAKLLESKDWSREESDALAQMAHKFDLRWPVIFDRWDRRLRPNFFLLFGLRAAPLLLSGKRKKERKKPGVRVAFALLLKCLRVSRTFSPPRRAEELQFRYLTMAQTLLRARSRYRGTIICCGTRKV